MYIENACNKVTVEQGTRLFAAVLFFCVNLREKMFDIPACVIHLQYVPNGYFYFSLKMEDGHGTALPQGRYPCRC